MHGDPRTYPDRSSSFLGAAAAAVAEQVEVAFLLSSDGLLRLRHHSATPSDQSDLAESDAAANAAAVDAAEAKLCHNRPVAAAGVAGTM